MNREHWETADYHEDSDRGEPKEEALAAVGMAWLARRWSGRSGGVPIARLLAQ